MQVYCVFFFCFFVRFITDFPAAEKDRDVKVACVFDYYSDRTSALLMNFGSQGVTAAA